MYGQYRSGEKVSYAVRREDKDCFLDVSLEANGRKTSLSAKVFLPEKEAVSTFEKGSPVIITMHPIEPIPYALSQGYAVIVLDTYKTASDDCKHNGCFYELYPYGDEHSSQTGVLMAWGWNASKVLDALYSGAGKELFIDPDASIVTGVSRWGKATAVAGAFDERFRMVIPACSGAGGLALYKVKSEGKTYDFSKLGEPSYTYSQNEPLSCLQSEGERGWFNDKFLEYATPEAIPYDQENLLELGVAKGRLYLVIAAYTGEDWVNAPSMYECFKRALIKLEERGLQDNVGVCFHKVGHAVIPDDMVKIIAWFNYFYYKKGEAPDMKALHSTLFS